jgi:hypothetical protein
MAEDVSFMRWLDSASAIGYWTGQVLLLEGRFPRTPQCYFAGSPTLKQTTERRPEGQEVIRQHEKGESGDVADVAEAVSGDSHRGLEPAGVAMWDQSQFE